MSRNRREIAPVHPGEILKEEFIRPLGMTMHELALALRVAPNRITQIVDGERSVSPETALRLGRYFGTEPEFWMNLQARYDLETAKSEAGEQIEHDVRPRPMG
jgi:addiction module HigA family antidote